MSEIGRVNYGLTGEVGTTPITEYGKKSRVCKHGISAWKCTECMVKKDVDEKEDRITFQEALSGLCKHGVNVKKCDACKVIDKKEELKSPEYFVMQRRELEEELLNNLLEAMPQLGVREVDVIMGNRWLILSELMNYDNKLMKIIREEMSNDK